MSQLSMYMYALDMHITVILAILCISDAWIHKVKTTPRPKAECGISPNAPSTGRIVGGTEAKPHSWPWQALFVCERDNLRKNEFGGSIISENWIITAAHTVYHVRPVYVFQRDCKVILGKHDVRREEPTQVVARIKKYIVHEKYDPAHPENGFDLALIKLGRSLTFTDAISTICLPFDLPELKVGKTCYVTGWGRTVYDNPQMSDTLKQLSMPVQEELYCRYNSRPTGRMICAGLWDRNEDACEGDSGGPFSCKEPDQKWYLRGVISVGQAKCDSVAGLTKVEAFEEWIKSTMAHN